MMLKRTATLCVLAIVVGTAGVAQAGITTVLDKQHQGQGNKGPLFRPVDTLNNDAFFVLEARSSIDHTAPFNPYASGQWGTVYVDKYGTGVQTANASGSKGISGRGGHKDEELIFTFDAPILASSIALSLIDIDFGSPNNKDDPVLFISTAGSGSYGTTILEAEIQTAFTPTGNKRGMIDFSLLGSLAPGLQVDAFKIRETNGHIEVSGITNAVPEPATAGLVAFGAFLLFRRRRPAIQRHLPC